MKKNRKNEESEILTLQKENNKLKRAVAKLRKRLERFETVPVDFYDLDSEEKGSKNGESCPVCKSPDIVDLLLGENRLFRVCRQCKYRRNLSIPQSKTGSQK